MPRCTLETTQSLNHMGPICGKMFAVKWICAHNCNVPWNKSWLLTTKLSPYAFTPTLAYTKTQWYIFIFIKRLCPYIACKLLEYFWLKYNFKKKNISLDLCELEYYLETPHYSCEHDITPLKGYWYNCSHKWTHVNGIDQIIQRMIEKVIEIHSTL